ncbi:MAG: phosphatidylglycerophosphatase A [Acidobacteria bacterium]|nr:MAG: phosphatidylglycerophosphatase A [Acidobacteriota bacterium]PYY08269.1 MAG: phosphatidylglycerophosphatase A [Acidobacteriota bacterium]
MAASSPRFPLERAVSQPAGPWAWLVATLFGVGRLPLAPGTWGSAATVLLWWLVSHWIGGSWQLGAAIGLVVLATGVGIPAATRVERQTGRKDPQFVVIDEVVGQLIALIAVPVFWKSLLSSFILFRVFDTLKPPPVRQLEKLPEGIGIVMDDIGAGLYALAIMQALLHFGVGK